VNRLLVRTVGLEAPRRADDAKLYERTEVVPHSPPAQLACRRPPGAGARALPRSSFPWALCRTSPLHSAARPHPAGHHVPFGDHVQYLVAAACSTV